MMKLNGRKVLVMGLGLHGGGAAAARWCAEQGAEVTCTDLRDQAVLAPTLESLSDLSLNYVLGCHREEDFDHADIIVKNPAVPADSSWLKGRNNVETDISLFLQHCTSTVLAVTGSKGKSTVVTALHHILKQRFPQAKLGGNITVSPLTFLKDLKDNDPVVLELSSWQLADLRGRGILKPRIAAITNLMHDHQNRYASFADYEADKKVIYSEGAQETVFPEDDFGRRWAEEFQGPVTLVSQVPPSDILSQNRAWIDTQGQGILRGTAPHTEVLVPLKLKVPGRPFRLNALFAGVLARRFGMTADEIRTALEDFGGVPYRMEMFLEEDGIRYYDDTAATIPDASAEAVRGLDRPVILIAGGTDKELNFAPFDTVAPLPKRIVLLPGSATEIWKPRLLSNGARDVVEVDSMEAAVRAAREVATEGDAVLLSPGAASFGLFRHEFERGDAFKSHCKRK